MNAKLTIQEKLKDLRTEKGITLEELAEKVKIARSTLGNYENDEYKDISHTSIIALAEFYGVSTDYLLGLTENQEPVTASVADLHLDDDTAERLKSGAFNNRLWNEITKHPAFPLLLADMEVYIDGIASMQIKALNTTVDTARTLVQEKFHPSEDEYYMHTLKTAHIDEFQYFSIQIHDDLDIILRDLRESHKKDITSAPTESPADMIKSSMEEASEFKGSVQEKAIAGLCKSLGIDYSSLTPDEFQLLIKLFQRSKYIKNGIRKRGKRSK